MKIAYRFSIKSIRKVLLHKLFIRNRKQFIPKFDSVYFIHSELKKNVYVINSEFFFLGENVKPIIALGVFELILNHLLFFHSTLFFQLNVKSLVFRMQANQ